MKNDYELWEKRAEEAAKSGHRVLTMAICRTCNGRIPVREWPYGWEDIKNCHCGELIDNDTLDMAIFGQAGMPDLYGVSEDYLVKAD